MDDSRNVEQGEIEVGHETCEMSLDEHIERQLAALTLLGLGVSCETGWKALLVIAETAKIMNGFADFDPRPRAEELIEQARDAKAKVDEAKAREAEHTERLKVQVENGEIFPAPDNGVMH